MNSWFNPRTQDYEEFDPIVPELECEENAVLATLLGPDGEPLVEIRKRPTVPFGFQPPSSGSMEP